MPITSLQVRMARAALSWGVRELAAKANLSTDTITRAEQGSPEVTSKTWGALQRALEEAGIEFLPETDSVALHKNVFEAAICADPAMPLGVRRVYPR
jgi:ribosome-binding protein aMBF1 (putative translation factor)